MTRYSAGEIISANCPLVHILNDTSKSLFCDYCLLPSDQNLENSSTTSSTPPTSNYKLKRCSGCRHVYYCNSLCQKKDWKKHKFECNVYKTYYGELHRDLDRFLLRLYLFLANNASVASRKEKLQQDETIERSFEDLLTHKDDIKKDSFRLRHFEELCQRFRLCNIDFDSSTLFEYFCKICINSFSVLDVNLNEIGSALYIAESIFDHSCSPNAAPTFNGMYMEIRAMKEINQGDELSINYVDLKDNQDTRRKSLREQYYFECHCSRCTSDFDKGFDSERLKRLDTEMDALIDQESEWMKAYSLGQQTLPLYYEAYGNQFHPDVTLQLVRLTKLRLWITDDLDNEGIQLISKTGKHIAITHGHNHQLYAIYRKLLNLD